MLINFTNHPSDNWGEKQLLEAKKYGEIKDLAFPKIDPNSTSQEIQLQAKQYVEQITSLHPKAVLVQGEMTFTYNIVRGLKEKDILVLCACSARVAHEEHLDDGQIIKNSIFKFIQFREY